MNIKQLTIVLVLIFLILQFSIIDREYSFTREGNEFYKKKDFAGAAKQFEYAELVNPESPLTQFNKATALAKQQKFDEAAAYFQKSANNTNADKSLRSDAHYNLGNILVEQQKYSDAINHYKKSLKNNPSHLNAKYNLTYAQNLLQQQQQQNQPDKNKEDKKDNNEQNKEEQNQDNQDNKKDNNKQDEQKEEQNKQDKKQAEQLLESIANSNKINDPKNKENIILKGFKGKAW